MGGRGAFLNSAAAGFKGIAENEREYTPIGTIDGMKVIVPNNTQINKTPVRSNKPNRIYIVADKNGKEPYSIGFYKNHTLIKTIDFDGEPHAHLWKTTDNGITMRDGGQHKRIPLTKTDNKLIEKAIEFFK